MNYEESATYRYLRIIKWARLRYTDASGYLTISKGGELSIYRRIEQAAFARYLGGAS